MTSDGSFQELLGRLSLGDDDAADEIFRRYAQRLIALAHSRLAGRIRQKVDPEDVMQSVFRSFFARHRDGQYDLESWNSLWSLLVVMTLHKCGHQAARFLAARRTVNREVASSSSDSTPACETLAREPSPAEVAMLGEIVEQLMRSLNPREQQMLSLRLQGCSEAEISVEVGRSERTVQRLMEKLRGRLLQMGLGDTTAC